MRIRSAVLSVLTTTLLAACGGANVESPASPPQQLQAASYFHAEESAMSLTGIHDAYTIQKTTNGYQFTNTKDGTVSFASAETKRVQFADISLALDIVDAGKIYRLYQAAFNRQPDLGGFSYWLGIADEGNSLLGIAAEFIQSEEFRQIYGTSPTDRQFLIKLYDNVLHRLPDDDGLNYWLAALSKGMTRPQALLSFSEAAENVAQVAPAIQNGILYARAGVAYTPVARGGPDQQARVGTSVQLDGGGSSDANGDVLSYAWSVVGPDGAVRSLPNALNGKTAFVPASSGLYTAMLTVSDAARHSTVDNVFITVGDANVSPITDTGIYKCSSISHQRALELFAAGHTYLDRDSDGKPCEANDIQIEVWTPATPVTPTPPSTGQCYVNGYYRKNGTYVHGYWRRC
jgi:hypothetical protein